jgi:hypothetical protein
MVIGGFARVSVQVKKCVIKICHDMYVCLCVIIGYTGKCMRICDKIDYDSLLEWLVTL